MAAQWIDQRRAGDKFGLLKSSKGRGGKYVLRDNTNNKVVNDAWESSMPFGRDSLDVLQLDSELQWLDRLVATRKQDMSVERELYPTECTNGQDVQAGADKSSPRLPPSFLNHMRNDLQQNFIEPWAEPEEGSPFLLGDAI